MSLSILPAHTYWVKTYRNTLFSLAVYQKQKSVAITMRVHNGMITTGSLPFTLPLLQKYLPCILKSICFNDTHDPFYEEVKHTEIGHLFEHILLEYLCLVKVKHGFIKPSHQGITQWNWQKDTTGMFHITIDAGREDEFLLTAALEKSTKLLTRILQSAPRLQHVSRSEARKTPLIG